MVLADATVVIRTSLVEELLGDGDNVTNREDFVTLDFEEILLVVLDSIIEELLCDVENETN